jgi:putative flippase GtrA
MSAVIRAQRRPVRRDGLGPKLVRYAAGSGIATACSEAVFLLVYGPMHGSPALASVLGWLAGAIPNFWLNRNWAWGRSGRPSLVREVLPYVAIILATLGLAIVATGIADRVLRTTSISAEARTLVVGATFLLVYVGVFVVRFLLLDRLFGSSPDTADDSGRRHETGAQENT